MRKSQNNGMFAIMPYVIVNDDSMKCSENEKVNGKTHKTSEREVQ